MSVWFIAVVDDIGSQRFQCQVDSRAKDAALNLALEVLKGMQIRYPGGGAQILLRVQTP